MTPRTSFRSRTLGHARPSELVPGGLFADNCLRMDTPRIRPAAAADAPTIGRLLDQLGDPSDASGIPGRIEKLQARPGTVVLVAEGQGGALRISLTSALHRESAPEFYKARDYEHTGVRLTKVFVNRSGAPSRGKGRASRSGVADDARNKSRG